MAASSYQTVQYSAENFVESVGAIAIKLSSREICLVHHEKRGEWLLAKGRRNAGEARHAAALREVKEETGFSCRMLPLTMRTRAPPATETSAYPDEPRTHEEACEPFMLTCRHLHEDNIKLIWWYIAALNEDIEMEQSEMQFKPCLMSFDDALSTLTFELDHEIVRKAIDIFDTYQYLKREGLG